MAVDDDHDPLRRYKDQWAAQLLRNTITPGEIACMRGHLDRSGDELFKLQQAAKITHEELQDVWHHIASALEHIDVDQSYMPYWPPPNGSRMQLADGSLPEDPTCG